MTGRIGLGRKAQKIAGKVVHQALFNPSVWLIVLVGPGTAGAALSEEASLSGQTNSSVLSTSLLGRSHPELRTDWKISTYGRGVSDQNDESRVAGAMAKAGLDYQYEKMLTAQVTGIVMSESGSSHSVYDINQPHSGFFLDQASTEITPLNWLALEGGALNQRTLNNPLLMDENPFPAVREKLKLPGKSNVQAALVAQQAIPTSVKLSAMTEEREPLPSFQTQTVEIDADVNSYKLNFVGGHFSFADLPSKVAIDSSRLGSEIDNPGSDRAHFRHGYNGWTASTFGEMPVTTRWSQRVGANYLVNTEAPANNNMGYSVYAQSKLTVSSRWQMIPRYEWFENQRDSAPAYYNSPLFAHNNRQGYFVELKFDNPGHGLAVKGQYVDSRLLEQDSQQVNTQFFFLGLELTNATL